MCGNGNSQNVVQPLGCAVVPRICMPNNWAPTAQAVYEADQTSGFDNIADEWSSKFSRG